MGTGKECRLEGVYGEAMRGCGARGRRRASAERRRKSSFGVITEKLIEFEKERQSEQSRH